MNVPRIVRGFAAGFVAVLVFHQAALLVLHLAGLVPGVPWRFDPVPPLGVPAVVSAAFWGGVWGIIFVLLSPRFGRGVGYWAASILFGAVAPTLVAWFVVAPLKGLPVGGSFAWPGVIIGPIVNGAWGLGTALVLIAIGGPIPRSARSGA
jgi:hypothetical protein